MTEVGLAALSDDVRIIVGTPAARQASMTFWVPVTFVWVASNGLYSPDSTCLSAAQWKTTSMPSQARSRRSRSRMSPIRKRTSSPTVAVALVELLGLVASEDAHDLRVRAASRWSTSRAPTVPEPPVTSTRRPWRCVGHVAGRSSSGWAA